MNRLTLLLVRHGETDWNKTQRVMGTSNTPLNSAGKKQARKLASYIKKLPIHHIISSPLVRAAQTAQILHSQVPHATITYNPLLREREFGILEGKFYAEANRLYPQFVFETVWQYPSFKPPGGESIREVQTRARKLINELISNYEHKTVILVTHEAFIRNFLSVALAIPHEQAHSYRFDNASVSIINISTLGKGDAHIFNLTVPDVP